MEPMRVQYFPRLDGVRGLAVLGVLITHFMWFYEPLRTMELGRTGVRMFFVLSGFLITRILLDYRSRMSVREAARQFYWRRFLRLAPPFYLAIVVSLILGAANMRTDWPWHVFYLSNFLLAIRGTSEPVGHLWSLAVEEQFYLAWFAVVVWLPRKYLLPTIAFAILFAPLFRFLTMGWTGRPLALTPAVIDCLAFGALIGWASLNNQAVFRLFADWRSLLLSLALLIWAIGFDQSVVILGTAEGLFSACFVARAASTEARGLDWLLLTPLKDLGKISYGVYLYHGFLTPYLKSWGGPLLATGLIWVSVVVAALSWMLIEKPALKLKGALPPRKAVNLAAVDVTASR